MSDLSSGAVRPLVGRSQATGAPAAWVSTVWSSIVWSSVVWSSIVYWLVVLGLIGACVAPTTARRIHDLRVQQAESDRSLARAEDEVARLSASWADVVSRYQHAEWHYLRTHRFYHHAIEQASYATEDAEAARRDWQIAQRQWLLYRTIVMVAVAMEAGRYRGRSFACDRVSTSAFRRLLMSQGRSLIGMDIDHIVPRSLGGADHPMNYQVISASKNRSLGARFDAGKCMMAGRTRCAEALAVSKKCGTYAGPWF